MFSQQAKDRSTWILTAGLLLGLFGTPFAQARGYGSGRGAGTRSQGSEIQRGKFCVCWTVPDSSTSTSSSSDTSASQYGIIFSTEDENNGEVAADLYSLTSDLRKVKQIGHSDVTIYGDRNNGYSFASATDSPTEFTMTLAQENTSSEEPQNEWASTLTSATLLTGSALNGLSMKCVTRGPLAASAPSPTASPSPTPSPSPSGVSID